MKLLAVSETDNGRKGSIADLYLEIKPGTGRVFLETFPLTRVDTQISTRFAKEIACDFAEIDCSLYDFFYTITAESAIVAGPSAGAAITVLTYSLITGTAIDDDTAITGTINSGGLIGPVGGIEEKVAAAKEAGFDTVIIPSVESVFESNATNKSLDPAALGKKYKIKIIPAVAIEEALSAFTGKRFANEDADISITSYYTDTMKELAVQLCSRSDRLRKQVKFNMTNQSNAALQIARNLTIKSKGEFDDMHYYSAASYCFGANVEFNHVILLRDNYTQAQLAGVIRELRYEALQFEKLMDEKVIETITDLEAYMVVKERLGETQEFLSKVTDSNMNATSLRSLAYARERLNSAYAWASFLQNHGQKFNLRQDVIKDACMKKIAEAEERFQFVQLYVPEPSADMREELNNAYQDLHDENYELCLFKASKAKADSDTLLILMGVPAGKVDQVIDQKLKVAARNLAKETEKGIFPILAYSYYEYGTTLRSSDPFSSLLYASYALELGDLDIYFKDSMKGSAISEKISITLNPIIIGSFFLGAAVGILAFIALYRCLYPAKKKYRETPTKLPLPGKKR